MLSGGNPLTVGVGIVIEVIRKNNSDYDPDMGADEGSTPSCRDPIYLGTLLRLFAGHVPEFMRLIMHAPTTRQDIHSTFGHKIEPLGFDRFKTCELMAELLHCSNMGLMNEPGAEELISARDAERHRLRGDGSLVPRRDEDPSMEPEDMTMRFSSSQGAPAAAAGTSGGDEKHLKITNVAEDDGFEEVEHSREMNEDTSHEFVKAEEEMPPPVPIPSFFDKDEDELMDEPLSSPRLRIRDEELAEGFEEPDMVVAPLSPKKKAVAPEAPEVPESAPAVVEGQGEEGDEKGKAKEQVQDDDVKPEVKAEVETKAEEKGAPESNQEAKDETSTRVSVEEVPEGDDSDSSVVHTPVTGGSQSEHETDSKEAESKPSEPSVAEQKAPEPAQAKDESQVSTQAPSVSPAGDDTAVQAAEPTNTPADATPAPAAPALEDDVGPPTPPRPGTAKNDEEAGTESILIAAPDPPTSEKATPVQPVVGDYLKMQFVEHKVVPTILVRELPNGSPSSTSLGSSPPPLPPGTS